ncbi:MAG: Nramp family divalent metal transporter [Sulfolobales archaeon]
MGGEVKEYFRLGEGPALEVVEKLPTPEEVFKVPKLSGWKLFATVFGPSFTALGGALGSGEWLMGPTVAVSYGMKLFWIAWVGCLFQTIYNIAFCRMTMLVGEPALVYFARVFPRKFWIAWNVAVLFFALSWPGWALGAATALGSIVLGRVPGVGVPPEQVAADAVFVRYLGIGLFLFTFFVVMFGGKIYNTLEYILRFKVLFVTFTVFILAIIYGKPEIWAETLEGYVSIGYIPPGVDIFLLGGWWGYTGWLSAINFLMSNWYRDKGYGVGALVGYLPAIIGGKKIEVSPVGKIFKLTPENLATWKRWEKLLVWDQWLIFFPFGVIGMTMPAILVASFIPIGTRLPEWGIAAHVATQFGAMWGPIGYYFISLVGLIVLWGTQLQIMDTLTRNMTDLLWSTSEGIRKWAKGDVRRVYYPFMACYIAFAMWAIWQAPPLIILLLSANIANFGGYAVFLLYRLERKLPKELRLRWYYWIFLYAFAILCWFFFVAVFILGWLLGIKVF